MRDFHQQFEQSQTRFALSLLGVTFAVIAIVVMLACFDVGPFHLR